MPRDLFDVFVIVCEYILLCTVWSCWVKNIHHSFVDWTGIERSCPQLLSSPRRIGFGAVVRRKPTAARRVSGRKAAWGRTPLQLAAENGHVAAAEFLLSKGAAVDAKDNWGPGPQSGKHAPDISNLGHFKMLFDWNSKKHVCIFSKPKTCEKCWDQWSHVAMAGASKAETGPEIESLQLGALQESFWDRNSVLQHC